MAGFGASGTVGTNLEIGNILSQLFTLLLPIISRVLIFGASDRGISNLAEFRFSFKSIGTGDGDSKTGTFSLSSVINHSGLIGTLQDVGAGDGQAIEVVEVDVSEQE